MSQSLTKIYIHLVFSTKARFPFILPEWRKNLYAVIAGILCNFEHSSFNTIGGTTDHIHILFCLPATKTLSDIVKDIKRNTSFWMKEQGCQKFAWQGGYAAFSVSETVVEATMNYIKAQEEHHRKRTFIEEVKQFCALYKIETYDEAYFTND